MTEENKETVEKDEIQEEVEEKEVETFSEGTETSVEGSEEKEVEIPVLDEEELVEVTEEVVKVPEDELSKRPSKKVIGLVVAGLLLVGGITYTVVTQDKTYSVEQVEQVKDTYYLPMNFEQLSNKLNSSETMLVYLGRDDCKGCMAWNQKALPILKEHNARVYYVETKKQGEKNPELKEKILGDLGVSSVPQFLIYEKGQLVKQLDAGEDLNGSVKELKEWLED